MKHEPQITTGKSLCDRILANEQLDNHDWSDVLDDEHNLIESVMPKFFVVVWPEHCVTTQHLGDASIHGPYVTVEEAASCITP